MMRFRTVHRWMFLAALCLSGLSHAQENWTLTTSDFQTRRVVPRSIDADGIVVEQSPNRTAARIQLEDFLQLDRAAVAPATDQPTLFLYLLNGDRLAGHPVGIEGETLAWGSSIGEIGLSLRQLRAVTREGHSAGSEVEAEEDIITLTNGDRVRGIISGVDTDRITLDVQGHSTEVPMNAVAAIHFAALQRPKPSTERTFRIQLRDGSSITSPSLSLASDRLRIELAGEDRRIALERVDAIEQVNGPVSWLSSHRPIESAQTPFLDMAWPAQFDRSVSGDPIRFGARVFTRGIGVHARSRLVYELDGTHRSFRTQYAIDGDRPFADVTVRIRVGDKLVHEQTHVKAGTLSPVIRVDCDNAPTLTLEVDYGDNYDVQDRFNWIEPALLRE